VVAVSGCSGIVLVVEEEEEDVLAWTTEMTHMGAVPVPGTARSVETAPGCRVSPACCAGYTFDQPRQDGGGHCRG
jgi:hypothetical protein